MVGCRILQDENARGAICPVAQHIPSGDNAAVVLCHHGFEHEKTSRSQHAAEMCAAQKLLRMIGIAGLLGVGRVCEDHVEALTRL